MGGTRGNRSLAALALAAGLAAAAPGCARTAPWNEALRRHVSEARACPLEDVEVLGSSRRGRSERVFLRVCGERWAYDLVARRRARRQRRQEASVPPPTGASSGAPARLTGADVRPVIERASERVRRCYLDGLRWVPTLGGRMAVQFTVDVDGSVSTASAPENDLTPEVAECVVDVFRSLEFPPPGAAPITFSFPFYFQPSGGGSPP